MTSNASSTKASSGDPRKQRRFGAGWALWVAALTILAMAAGLVAPNNRASDGAVAVGSLSPSMVEMLNDADSSHPMTLEEVRKYGQAYLGGTAYDGSGIDVAVIDTGVAPVIGLNGPDKVLHGPDLSFEGETPEVAYLDTYGHGTHMAGIIAGDRPGHEGIAPGARIVSVKTAGHDGLTTVPQVVAAIDWVIEHRNADGLNIRVLNLSLGQAGVKGHVGDHLSAAVERAWDAGIFVVVAAGNRGETQGHLDSPAIDPYVMAVGAYDLYAESEPTYTTTKTLESTYTLSTSSLTIQPVSRTIGGVPPWSAQGDGLRNPDGIANGRSIASYRVAGSTIDMAAPGARYGDDLFLGSGTSQSAAVVSGVAALMLQAQPSLNPDQLKAALTRSANDLPVSADRDGNGILSGYQAASKMDIAAAGQVHPRAYGAGTGVILPTGATWTGGQWAGGQWAGATWTGATWTGGQWAGGQWAGATWSGATWSGATWSGGQWAGATWSGATWSGATWSGATWSGNGWD